MNIKDLVEFLYDEEQTGDVGSMVCERYGEGVDLDIKHENVPDKHRHYSLSDIVYEVFYTGNSLGFICVTEVSDIYSESCGLSDICHMLYVKEVFPVEKTTIVYE